MARLRFLKSALAGGASAIILAGAAQARNFDIPGGDLDAALAAYSSQSGIELIVSASDIKGVHTRGVVGDLSADAALTHILSGTGFVVRRNVSGKIGIAREDKHSEIVPSHELAQATPVRVVAAAAASVETIVVTSSKIRGDIQTVPIAITALSQEQLTSRQIAGGPDLVKEVPNLTFSKTNFSGYNVEIRGIGTQAVSISTDPAVAVALNDIPFIRNHFFEQEFFDVTQVEVLRGPQGTLYGRNATAGVVNVISSKPTDQFEAMLSADWGNYSNRRYEGMVNVPVVGDKLDIRVAGEWTKRDGYSFNQENGRSIDGRDLWSSRATIGWKPAADVQTYLVWEHFQEDDDRLRSGKQICVRDPGPSMVDGPVGPQIPNPNNFGGWLSQGCLPGSLYGPAAFGTPNAAANPFVGALEYLGPGFIDYGADPYASVVQPKSLRVIDSLLNPSYRAKNDTVELNTDYHITGALTLTSQTGYNKDFLYSTEDYDRFNSAAGIFLDQGVGQVGQDGEFCDPQLGCSNRLVGEDIAQEHAWQFSQELRLASDFSGPLNFSVGANYLYYQTTEDYYVFFNGITLFQEWVNEAIGGGSGYGSDTPHASFDAAVANSCGPKAANLANVATAPFGLGCAYIDPNPLGQIDGQGHNYFVSQNPYRLDSWAGFGEVYYQLLPGLKLTGGLRWTDDKKHFDYIPSWTLVLGKGYPTVGAVDQQWKEWTGRFNVSWTPKLDFTDQSLFYGSYARGYKGGGANPPGVVPLFGGSFFFSSSSDLNHPLTFNPEFVNAFELGTKNTLLDGAVTFDGDLFYYNYKGYQISQIVDRTSVNWNFNANVKGVELESTWEPVSGLRFSFAGGYENATLAKGSQAIDLMDRTAGNPNWMVIKPFITQTSNCVFPTYVVNELIGGTDGLIDGCLEAYSWGDDPVTGDPYAHNPNLVRYPNYPGFDPNAGGIDPNTGLSDPYTGQNTYNGVDYGPAPNGGAGFYKNISGNQVPDAPHFTTSLSADYTIPVSEDWAATLHSDFYWQSQSFARVFNDRPYDKIRGYSNVNLALILTSASGWQVMGYLKNIFDTTAITGDFLNSDDSGLTTNVFLTDPRLFGVRVTKNW